MAGADATGHRRTLEPAVAAARSGGARSSRARAHAAFEIALDEALRPGLDQHVAEGRRLDRTGHHRQPARIGRELAEQPVADAAADDVDDVDRPAGQPVGVLDGARVGRGEAVEDAADQRGPRRRARLVGRGSAAAIRAGMSPGGRKTGSSGSKTRAAARQPAAAARSAAEVARRARRSQVRIDSWSSHRPITLRR